MKITNYLALVFIGVIASGCQSAPNGKAEELLNFNGDVKSIEEVVVSDGDTIKYSLYEISENRDITSLTEQEKGQGEAFVYNYVYSTNRDILRKNRHSNGVIDITTFFTYDKNGYLTETLELTPDMLEVSRNIYENDSLGRVVDHKRVKSGSLLQFIDLYQYDTTNNVSKRFICNEYQDTLFIVLPTYESDRLVEANTTDMSGEVVQTVQYIYNEQGVLVEEKMHNTRNPDAEIKQEMILKFDKKGNWVEKNIRNVLSDKILETTTRTYIYF